MRQEKRGGEKKRSVKKTTFIGTKRKRSKRNIILNRGYLRVLAPAGRKKKRTRTHRKGN